MGDRLAEIKSELAQIEATVKANKGDGTLDVTMLANTVLGLVDKQTKLNMEEAERNRPRYRGEVIGAGSDKGISGFGSVSKGVVQEGKFAGQLVDDVLFTHWLLGKARRKEPGWMTKPNSKELEDIVAKNLDATTAGAGDEYVPTGMQAELWNDFFLASKIVPAIGVTQMPTDPFDLPLGWGLATWRRGSAGVATTNTDMATQKVTLTSTEQIAEVDWAYDLDEDAVIAVLPTLRTEIGRGGAEQMDAFVLNADATATATGNLNSDDATPPSDSYYLTLGQAGIRKAALLDNTGMATSVGGSLADANIRTILGTMDKYAASPDRLVMAVDAQTYVKSILGLTNVATMDKFGPQATVLTGQLAQYAGVPIIVSASIPRTDADGKYTTISPAANDTKGTLLVFHRDMWKVGFRRQLLIELDRNIQKRQFLMVVSFRIAVAARGTRSTQQHSAVGYNIT